jgi:hypothetical protein
LADIVSVLGAVPEGVKVTWQVVVPIGIGGVVTGASVHGDPVSVPAPELVTVTVPVGLRPGRLAVDVSVTVTVQVVAEPALTGETQVMLVEVVRTLTVRVTVLLVLPL